MTKTDPTRRREEEGSVKGDEAGASWGHEVYEKSPKYGLTISLKVVSICHLKLCVALI